MKYFQKIKNIGVDNTGKQRNNLKIISLNIIAFLTLSFNAAYILFNCFYEQWLAVLINFQFATTAALIFYFNAKKQMHNAFLVTSIGFPLTFLATAIAIGDGYSTEYFFLITAAATPLLYDHQHTKYRIFFSNLFVFALVKAFHFFHPAGFGETPFPFYFEYINDFVILVLLFLVIENAFTNNLSYQTLLVRQNRIIKELNTTLEQKVEDRTAEIQSKAEALARSNEEIKRLAYLTSHDLREPLRNIASFSQLIQKNIKSGDFKNIDEYTEYINWAIRRMDRLTNDIKVYTEIERGKLEVQSTNLNILLENILTELSPQIGVSNAQVQAFQIPIQLHCNANQIRLLFYNLIENALIHSQKMELQIHINAQEERDYWQFEIQDNGIGIEAEYHSDIFTMFRRLNNDLNKESSGIGLALCRKIVLNHNGKIWLESTINQGTSFQFKTLETLQNS